MDDDDDGVGGVLAALLILNCKIKQIVQEIVTITK